MNDILGLEGKVALVVGGGFGMGETSALGLARAGCHVGIVDISEERAMQVVEQIRALGGQAMPIAVDVLDVASAASAIAGLEREFGSIDVLVTIVGQAEIVPVLEITPEQWDHEFSRNLRYVFFWAQAAAQAMVRAGRGGSITAVGSVAGMNSGPGHAAYAAAKAGLINLVRSMAVELAPHDIRVNVVAPGVIKTPRIAVGQDFAAWDALIRNSLIPQRRMGETKEVADAILFLSSDMATYVTGATLAVDGGFTAQWILGVGSREQGSGKGGQGEIA